MLMLYKLGRLLQLCGMVILPVAIAGELARTWDKARGLDLREFLTVSGVGVLIFFAGWLLQQLGRPK
jgi:hypothetical protein